MSRMPPVPDANKSAYGPDGVSKTSVDISHRVRHSAQRLHDHQEARPSSSRQPDAVDDLGGGFIPGHRDGSQTWMLIALGAVLTGIVCLAGSAGSRAETATRSKRVGYF